MSDGVDLLLGLGKVSKRPEISTVTLVLEVIRHLCSIYPDLGFCACQSCIIRLTRPDLHFLYRYSIKWYRSYDAPALIPPQLSTQEHEGPICNANFTLGCRGFLQAILLHVDRGSHSTDGVCNHPVNF